LEAERWAGGGCGWNRCGNRQHQGCQQATAMAVT
jgi:hypothetical protein